MKYKFVYRLHRNEKTNLIVEAIPQEEEDRYEKEGDLERNLEEHQSAMKAWAKDYHQFVQIGFYLQDMM